MMLSVLYLKSRLHLLLYYLPDVVRPELYTQVCPWVTAVNGACSVSRCIFCPQRRPVSSSTCRGDRWPLESQVKPLLQRLTLRL